MTSDAVSTTWFAVKTKPNMDARAAQRLAEQGFQVFFPVFRKRRSHARRVDLVAAPLFPGYGFVALDLARDQWRVINGTIGVDRLLCNGHLPLRVAPGVVERLIAHRDADGFLPLYLPSDLKAGDKVKVIDGSFAEAVGLVDGVSAAGRIAILLSLLGRDVRFDADAHNLEKAT